MKCVSGVTVRRFSGYSNREIDIYSFAKCGTRAADGKRRKLEWAPGRIVKLG